MMERFDPRLAPESLIRKYRRSGPRYTSYPTAPCFSTDFDATAVRGEWMKTREHAGDIGLYVHVPFCAARCLYCGCYTEIGNPPPVMEAYVETILREARQIRELLGDRSVTVLSLGGGTPTHLPERLLERLVRGVASAFDFAPGAELAIEVNPARVDTGRLDTLLDLGFNRFSFGVQDLDERVQEAVGRRLPAAHLETLMEHLHRKGVRDINLDLMYGLPLQTEGSFARTLHAVAGLAPSRVAVFGYAHVPWVSPHQTALERYELPGPEARTELFGIACEMLQDAGYIHVGMDHFARPGDPLVTALHDGTLTRNFMGYTVYRGIDLAALGASGISGVGATYTQNVKQVDAYVSDGGIAWRKALILSREDMLRREIILELFCNFTLDIAAFSRKHALDFRRRYADELRALDEFSEDGLVEVSSDTLRVTSLGRYFIRNICMVFDQYLHAGRFSRTI